MLLACAGGSASGTLVDAHADAPIGGADILLRAEGDDDCAEKHAVTDASGAFSLTGLCAGHTYTVTPADPMWRPEAVPTVKGGEKGTQVALRVWRAPTSDGLYLLDGTALSALVTQTAVTEALYAPASRALRFPTELPDVLPRVSGDQMLVLSGPDIVQDWALEPTWDGPTLTLGPPDAPREVWPWVYIGAKIRDDGALEPLTVTPEHTVDVGDAEHPLRYFPANAVPAGRYALLTPQGARALLLYFGDEVK